MNFALTSIDKRTIQVPKKVFAICFLLFLIGIFPSNSLRAQGLINHDFEDGDMGPFVHCTTQNPNYTRVVNNRLRTYWKASSYRADSRMTKGAEACGDPIHNGVGYLTYKHCWMGFIIHIDEDYMGPDYKGVGGLAQIFGFDHARGQSTWTAMLDIEDGDLAWVDRRGSGRTRADVVVYENFPKGEDVAMVIHAVLSDRDEGLVEIFIDGQLAYSAYDIRIGMGEFDSTDTQTNQSSTEFKIGQYNHSGAATADEIRIVDYDNISWYDGVDGYDLVDPTRNTSSICDSRDAFSRIQAEDYCSQSGVRDLDTKIGYINDGDWIAFDAIDFGDGAGHIRARVASNSAGGNIEMRLGSVSGTLLGTLEVSATGGWDVWETITGPISPIRERQKIYFVFRGHANGLFDIDWIRFTENNTLRQPNLDPTSPEIRCFPNPVADRLFLRTNPAFLGEISVRLLDLNGQILHTAKIDRTDYTIDMSIHRKGLYMIQITHQEQTDIYKIIHL